MCEGGEAVLTSVQPEDRWAELRAHFSSIGKEIKLKIHCKIHAKKKRAARITQNTTDLDARVWAAIFNFAEGYLCAKLGVILGDGGSIAILPWSALSK